MDYVKNSLTQGHSKDSVFSELKEHGWPESQIHEVFDEIERSSSSIPEAPNYRPEQRMHENNNVPTEQNSIDSGAGDNGYHKKFFRLQDDEKIFIGTKPLKGYFWSLLIGSFIGLAFLGIFFLPFTLIPAILIILSGAFTESPSILSILLLASGAILPIIILVADVLLIRRQYNMRYYWITSSRIIAKRGIIGYSINSIPLERISDVLISRSFIEKIFGFGSLHIQTMSGQYSPRGRGGAEGNLKAIPKPEEMQSLIFNLLTQKRKNQHITM
ncbi:MAG: PH domain-containing protein [Candidatus Peribacteraceae bacterium]|nr:PH domain-containing protein [Candidatus Peribacteraceae bacterium]